MPDPQQASPLEVVRELLLRRGAGYLRTVRWQVGLTCPMCAGVPSGDYSTCFHCGPWQSRQDLADRLGFMTYALKGSQSGHMMYAYKEDFPSSSARQTLALATAYTVMYHWTCLQGGPLGPVTHWATVPSLRGRTALNDVVAPIMDAQPLVRADLRPSHGSMKTRDLRPQNFLASAIPGAHVLLLEDTWVGGTTAQSAAAALKAAGAQAVTVLAVARWLDRQWGRTPELLTVLAQDPYDPDNCPFTGAHCR
jgi:hypothetical protein